MYGSPGHHRQAERAQVAAAGRQLRQLADEERRDPVVDGGLVLFGQVERRGGVRLILQDDARSDE